MRFARIIVHNNKSEKKLKIAQPSSDKVFLLSINETYVYFENDESAACGSWWWLRSPGSRSDRAADVRADGVVSTVGLSVDIDHGVRPALWIRIE